LGGNFLARSALHVHDLRPDFAAPLLETLQLPAEPENDTGHLAYFLTQDGFQERLRDAQCSLGTETVAAIGRSSVVQRRDELAR
jgi:hypothetical protein